MERDGVDERRFKVYCWDDLDRCEAEAKHMCRHGFLEHHAGREMTGRVSRAQPSRTELQGLPGTA